MLFTVAITLRVMGLVLAPYFTPDGFGGREHHAERDVYGKHGSINEVGHDCEDH